MSNKILTAENWQSRIRDSLGVSDSYLPNATIEQPENITIAEASIIGIVPDWEDMEGTDRVYLESAVVMECANILCLSMSARLPDRFSGPHASYELSIDWQEKKKEIVSKRDYYLSKITNIRYSRFILG